MDDRTCRLCGAVWMDPKRTLAEIEADHPVGLEPFGDDHCCGRKLPLPQDR